MIISKFTGAMLVSGLVAAGGSALTATGLVSNAPASVFIGGTVSQTVSGATLESITYGFVDTTNTQVNLVTLVFAVGVDGKTVSVAPSGNATPGGTFGCTAVGQDGSPANTSVCTWTPGVGGPPGYTGLNALAVTVVGDEA